MFLSILFGKMWNLGTENKCSTRALSSKSDHKLIEARCKSVGLNHSQEYKLETFRVNIWLR